MAYRTRSAVAYVQPRWTVTYSDSDLAQKSQFHCRWSTVLTSDFTPFRHGTRRIQTTECWKLTCLALLKPRRISDCVYSAPYTYYLTYLVKRWLLAGWSVAYGSSVSVHGLARARCAEQCRNVHRFHRTSTQDEGAVRTRRTHYRTLQVCRMLLSYNCRSGRVRYCNSTQYLRRRRRIGADTVLKLGAQTF